MRKILIFFILLFSYSCHSQRNITSCDTLAIDEHVQDVLGVHEGNLVSYLVKRGVDKAKISNRQSLQMLRILTCNDETILISDEVGGKIIHFFIEKGIEKFDPNYFLSPPIDSSNYSSFLPYKEEGTPYGFFAKDTVVSTIKSLTMTVNGQAVKIPKSAFEDLLFPNFCFTELSIKPIQAFVSENREYIYLYIFGEHRDSDKIAYNTAFQYSYMAKLIIDLEKGYQSRIVLRGDKLCYYNWDNCLDFTGF